VTCRPDNSSRQEASEARLAREKLRSKKRGNLESDGADAGSREELGD
jgi:hypothetical protein